MVADVAHLVAGDALELLVVHELQKPGGVGDRRAARTKTSGERVRRRVLDDVHGGRRNALTDRQSVDQVTERTIPISGSRRCSRGAQNEPGSRQEREQDANAGNNGTDDDACRRSGPHGVVRPHAVPSLRGPEIDSQESPYQGASDQPKQHEGRNEQEAPSFVSCDGLVHVNKLRESSSGGVGLLIAGSRESDSRGRTVVLCGTEEGPW